MVRSVLEEYNVVPICFVSDNASNCVLSNDMLADWANSLNPSDEDLGWPVEEVENLLEEVEEVAPLNEGMRKEIAKRSTFLPTPLAVTHTYLTSSSTTR